ncbi:amidohydrolase family protein [Limisalsivibrio acetivorans]|uniref:amidohydrolase family protein n=1 Tax=Limisalsivibrio acetivorans TaxID=1304888 RepID=UPI0003B51C54|nr:amidohydrolase family protein [Limisalsivibrio acetivorans]
MNKIAVFADFIHYDSRIEENKYLLIDGEIIEGLADKAPDGYDIKEKKNAAIFPALINTHTHLPMSIFRGMADDLPLMDWLQNHIWPAETKWLSDEFVHDATLLSCMEMIRCGTSTAFDMYFFSGEIASALSMTGLKGVVGVGVLDFPTKFANNADEYIKKASDLYHRYKEHPDIDVSLCPHAPYTVSPENYLKCVDFCGKHDLVLHTHLAETAFEIGQIKEKYGKTPVEIMNESGAFDIRSIFAHCVHLTDEEIELMGEKNVNIAPCTESNLKLVSGFAPLKKLMDAGANLTIATDGAASNNDIDMIGEMATTAKVHKAVNHDATAFSAETVLKMATSNAAKGLGLGNTGELKEGYKADFFVLSFEDAGVTPVYNPVSHLVYSAGRHDVTDTYVKGKPLMENRQILVADEEEIKNKARRWAKKIKESKN